MKHTISNMISFFTGPHTVTRKALTSVGDYQTVLRYGRRAFMGTGHTPAESRRNAIEAYNEATGTQVGNFIADRLHMVTERASYERELAQ